MIKRPDRLQGSPSWGVKLIKLVDRFLLRFCSKGEQIDGLWIGTDERNAEPLLQRVRAALSLIQRYDGLRYRRLTHDLRRVWVTMVKSRYGSYNHQLQACCLNPRYVLDETMTPELLASSIVHEATHARLMAYGIGYEEEIRPRVEAICVRRELAFSRKLPDGEQVRRRAEWALESYCTSDSLSDVARERTNDDWFVEEMRHLGIPGRVIRSAFMLRALLRPSAGASKERT